MKTVLDYSNLMPRSLRIRYLRNVVQEHGVERLFLKYKNLGDAVNHTMHWSQTTEGHEFWETVAHRGIKAAYGISDYKKYFTSTRKSF